MTTAGDLTYPVYVPSKGRHQHCHTGKVLTRDQVPWRLVVEPSEADLYSGAFPHADILVLPRDGMRLLGSRNWIREHSIAEGHHRHWQLDDNIHGFLRLARGVRVPVNAAIALRTVEQLTDRYTNVGVSGLDYEMFVTDHCQVPMRVNVHVYSCSLVNNDMPYRWRLLYNDDTDLCLQVLAGGMCTILVEAMMAQKIRTGNVPGGNTADLYQGDGRLAMARALERQWPHVVRVERRHGRPQHVIDWKRFRNPLQRRTDIDWDQLPQVDEWGMQLTQQNAEIRDPQVRALYDAGGVVASSE